MAVVVYKDGEKQLIDPLSLPATLAAGWSVKKDGNDARKQENEKAEKVEENNEEDEELKELKAKAKKLKIGHYWLMAKETLLEEIKEAEKNG